MDLLVRYGEALGAERFVDTVYRLDQGVLVGVEPGKGAASAAAVASAGA